VYHNSFRNFGEHLRFSFRVPIHYQRWSGAMLFESVHWLTVSLQIEGTNPITLLTIK